MLDDNNYRDSNNYGDNNDTGKKIAQLPKMMVIDIVAHRSL